MGERLYDTVVLIGGGILFLACLAPWIYLAMLL